MYYSYYTQEKTCTSFCIKLWADYYITIFFIKLILFYNLSYYASSMLSDTYYAQNYAGIIGMGLEVISSYVHGTVGQGMSEPINYY